MYRKKIFIGSSKEAKESAETVARILEDLDCIPKLWYSNEMFPGGDYTFNSLFNISHSVDAGLFILSEDDTITSRDESVASPRDNVLVEAGLFFGALGRSQVGLCVIASPKIPSDWKGITTIPFDVKKTIDFKEKLKVWLKNVKHIRNKEPNNVHMLARSDIHRMYPIPERLGIPDKVFEHIISIKMLNFASNLFINPVHAEISHLRQDTIGLSDCLLTILENTEARIQLVLAEPTDHTLDDAQSKIANSVVNSSGAIYSSLSSLFELMNNDGIVKAAIDNRRLSYYVTDISIPFAIFAVEYDDDYSFLSHVKIDLYSAALTSEDDRRSMIIWKNSDKDNYKFFVDNFNNVRKNLSRTPRPDEMQKWSDRWKELELNG